MTMTKGAVMHCYECHTEGIRPPASLPLPAAMGVPRSCDTRAASLLPTRGTLSSSVEVQGSAAASRPTPAPESLCSCPAWSWCWLLRVVPEAPCSARASSPGCTRHCCPCRTAAASFGDTLGLGMLSVAALRLRPAALASQLASPAVPLLLHSGTAPAARDEPSAGAAAAGCSAAAAARVAGASAALPTRSARDLKPAEGGNAVLSVL